jgi:HK97 family phage portal protein
MGLTDKIRAAISGASRSVSVGAATQSALLRAMGRGTTYTATRALTDGDTGWVAIASDFNAQKVAEIDFYVVRCEQDGGEIRRDRDETHPVADLLWRPNARDDDRSLFYQIAKSLELTDEAFLIKERNRFGVVKELVPVRPDAMREVRDAYGITGWQYTPPGTRRPIPYRAEDVIHIHRANLLDLRGSTRLARISDVVEADALLSRYLRAVVGSGGRLDWVLQVQSQDAAEIRRVQQAVASGLERASKAGHVMAVGEGMSLTPANLKPSDLSIFQLAEYVRDRILMSFKIPPEALGFRDGASSRASALVAESAHIRNAILPLASLIAGSLTRHLLPDFEDITPGASVWYEIGYLDATPADEELTSRIEVAEVGRIITVNEIRARRGLPPVDGGDELYASSGAIPLRLAAGMAEADMGMLTERGTHLGKAPGTRAEAAPEEPATHAGDPADDEEPGLREWRDWVRTTQRPGERRFLRMHRALVRRQQQEVLARLEAAHEQLAGMFEGRYAKTIARMLTRDPGLIQGILFDESEWNVLLSAAARAEIERLVKKGGADTLAAINAGIGFDVTRPDIIQWIDAQSFDHYASKVNATTLRRLRRTLTEGYTQGESVRQIAERIQAVYASLTQARAINAARTETTAALNYGTDQAHQDARKLGIRLGKKWLAGQDDRTRHSHSALHNSMADSNGSWLLSGVSAHFPGDPSLPAAERCMCRCAMRSVRLLDQPTSDDS